MCSPGVPIVQSSVCVRLAPRDDWLQVPPHSAPAPVSSEIPVSEPEVRPRPETGQELLQHICLAGVNKIRKIYNWETVHREMRYVKQEYKKKIGPNFLDIT